MANILLQQITKTYPGREEPVLKNLSLTLYSGLFHVLVGRSGCGKTTLLRLIAGLEEADSGALTYTEQKPKIGIVFQEPRLYPWLTVWDNVTVWQKGLSPGSIEKAHTYLHRFGLDKQMKAYPHQLSGGMAQRVAIARALSYEPDLLLLDEPFGALDYFTRQQLQEEIMYLAKEENKTVLFITHDITEASRLGEHILVMKGGQIQTIVTNQEPYPRPPLANRLLIEEKILQHL